MAGRPPAPTRIVDPNEILDVAHIRTEPWRQKTLFAHLADNDSALQWCARRRLIRNTLICPHCQQLCRFIRYNQGIDGRRWACATCDFTKSVRDNSFFSKSHLSLEQMVILIYMWSRDSPQKDILHEADIASEATLVDWCNFLREECETWLEFNSGEIGGMTDNGEPIVVEIDESKFFHRKYHRGQWHEGHWVFGGIERQTGNCFLVEVPDRRAETLNALIEQHILPGSHIVSDGWAAYAHIEDIRQGIYTHSVIVHQHHFVDPNDAEVHTENVENMWMRTKRKLKRQFGTSRDLFPSYLHEFVYRNKFRNEELFGNLLITIADNYQ